MHNQEEIKLDIIKENEILSSNVKEKSVAAFSTGAKID